MFSFWPKAKELWMRLGDRCPGLSRLRYTLKLPSQAVFTPVRMLVKRKALESERERPQGVQEQGSA